MDASSRRRLLAAGALLPLDLLAAGERLGVGGWLGAGGRLGSGDGGMSPPSDLLGHLDGRVAQITADYERSPISATAAQLRRHLPVVRSLLLRDSIPPLTRLRLHHVTGRLGALWATTRHDLGDVAGAAAAFDESYAHAAQAGDATLMCWIRLWQSSLARKAGRLADAAELAAAGAALVGSGTPAAARAAAIEARAHGALGDRWAVHQAIGRAWHIAGALSEEQHGEPGFSIDTLHVLTLSELSAAAYVELGMPGAASVYTDAAIHHLDAAGATGLRSMVRIAAATAAAKRRDLDQAVELVDQALTISGDRPSTVIAGRSRRFVSEARGYVGWHADLDDLDDRVRAWKAPRLAP
ncbi:hypothetical protein Ga0074812_12849 [Parafrankia irregularis]|uniref:Uncharacterized protein n=1 Tax=Parafrankia irregularis TaxID=795642 RepID=A0A0S4QV40_9ACTN|nr:MULTISPECIES: hypothetical protein [Parafrankia]MBE3201933.1 hypothetical protein [Parafrankia sp. CH37]CUU59479.1 hypothetical protein Ga0074812_12849 [Parafrankia irregularis]